MLRQRPHVLGVAANRQNAAGDLGVQRLHAPVEHFGKAGDLGDVPHRHAALANQPRRAAGGDEFRAQLHQRARELHNPGLVGDADECPPNLSHQKDDST